MERGSDAIWFNTLTYVARVLAAQSCAGMQAQK